MLDLEAAMLQDWYGDIPVGPRRYLNLLWAFLVKQYVWPHGDVDWYEYCEWVAQGGGEDPFLSSPSSGCVQEGFLTDQSSEES